MFYSAVAILKISSSSARLENKVNNEKHQMKEMQLKNIVNQPKLYTPN